MRAFVLPTFVPHIHRTQDEFIYDEFIYMAEGKLQSTASVTRRR